MRKRAIERSFRCTDFGNAEMFSAFHGNNVRFDHKQQRWLIWDLDRMRWIEDRRNEVRNLMKETARKRFQIAFTNKENEERKRQIGWALQSENRSRIDAALELAKGVEPISDEGNDWDAMPYLLGVKNGVLDLLKGRLRANSPRERITKFGPFSFDPAAKCERWEQFLKQVFNGDSELINFIQKALGYSLTGSTKEQCLFACYGSGSNGKSTLFEVVLQVLGDYAIDLPAALMEARQNSNAPGEGINLPGARFAKAVELNEGRRLDEARVKAWTGGDTISIRPLYRNAFSFRPSHKLWLAFNHKPIIKDESDGMWRRIRLVPFLQNFGGKLADKNLLQMLVAEGPGILMWMVKGCLKWQREGLEMPRAVAEATADYRAESDQLGQYFRDRVDMDPAGGVTAAILWANYLGWAEENEEALLSRRSFGDILTRRGLTRGRFGRFGTRTWVGIRLRAEKAASTELPSGTDGQTLTDTNSVEVQIERTM